MMNMHLLNRLSDVKIFQATDVEILKEIMLASKTILRHYEKDQLMLLRGDPVDYLMIIINGRLLAHINSMKGKMLRIETLHASQPVASGILFAKDNRLPVSLLAEEATDVLFIPKDTVLELCRASRSFMLNCFRDMGDKISILAEKIRLYQFNTIKQKIAGYLLGLSGPRNIQTVKLVYSKEVLAEIMGVTRPALSREFSNLSSDGLIDIEGKSVRILDKTGLENILLSD